MSYSVLSNEQVEQFKERGWVKLAEGFPREVALACQDLVWERMKPMGMLKDDSSTWTKPMVQINEAYSHDDFQLCNTKRLADAIEDLIGAGRWAERSVCGETELVATYGWWPVNFALGSDKAWDVPKGGWHWDGQHFRHYVDSPEQGLLCLCLFSEIGTRGGGTLVAEGSHKIVAKYLSAFPDGTEQGPAIGAVNRSHPWMAELTGESEESGDGRSRVEKFMTETIDAEGVRLRVVETTGSPGDVILCHPFLYHAPSANHAGTPRFMCNRTTPLKDRMEFDRTGNEGYSPLELSIKEALSL
ncbi:hypothetical protein SY83_06080 [Paenibacillus swuensis]|uniref:Phytanoyl-CoA dioxygenase n=1 Tax=Paenibacillus swuensis TaxID=1178515 RepID=A0A172TFU8_9BACL|nr:hypothetical protein [Paenibacillus swuensis]ANE45929.1 hypothetical protein SY83_06080 [Paenibacillus swuensis]